MRVQYTLPGFQPAPQERTSQPGAQTFHSRLRQVARHATETWEQILRLNRPPQAPEYLAAPPRPASLESRDVNAERQHWQQIANRGAMGGSMHATELMQARQIPVADLGRVEKMLALMRSMQSAESAVMARSLAERRG